MRLDSLEAFHQLALYNSDNEIDNPIRVTFSDGLLGPGDHRSPVQPRRLEAGVRRSLAGAVLALDDITLHLAALVGFYPGHIEKEDKHFFFPTQEYFSKDEQAAMLREFEDFDAKMIHEKYSEVVERFESA